MKNTILNDNEGSKEKFDSKNFILLEKKARGKNFQKQVKTIIRSGLSWRPHFGSGILTCYIKPKYEYDPYKWGLADNTFYALLQYAVLVLNLAWLLGLFFLLFWYSESVNGFINVTVVAFIAEIIYKAVHARYKYF